MFKRNGESKKHVDAKHKKADCDPTSLGSLLKAAKIVTPEQLAEACQYQIDNQDEMLGEILIKLGYITEETFTTMMAKQSAMRNGFKRSEMNAYFSIARRKTNSVGQAHEDLREAAMQLVKKLNKAEG